MKADDNSLHVQLPSHRVADGLRHSFVRVQDLLLLPLDPLVECLSLHSGYVAHRAGLLLELWCLNLLDDMAVARRTGPQHVLDLHPQSLALVQLILSVVLAPHQLALEPPLLLDLLVLEPLVVFLGALLLDDLLDVDLVVAAILLLDRNDALVFGQVVFDFLDLEPQQLQPFLRQFSSGAVIKPKLDLLVAFRVELFDQKVAVDDLLLSEVRHVRELR